MMALGYLVRFLTNLPSPLRLHPAPTPSDQHNGQQPQQEQVAEEVFEVGEDFAANHHTPTLLTRVPSHSGDIEPTNENRNATNIINANS